MPGWVHPGEDARCLSRLLHAVSLVALLLLSSWNSAAGQEYQVTTWQKEDGLPTDTITAITQTPDGFLWVGTTAGLLRFDGVRFVPVGRSDGLADASIRRLFLDRSGAVWIATADARVFRHMDGKFTRMVTQDTGTGVATSFAQHRDGSVWLSTDSGCLLRFHRDQFVEVLPATSTNRIPSQLAADVWGDGTLWFRKGLSVGFLEGTNWTEIRRVASTPERIGPMTPRRAGGVWLFAAEFRIDVLGQGRWPLESKRYPPFMDPSCLLEDSSGRFWIGTYQQGLVLTSTNRPEMRFFTGTGFPIDAVNCLFEDHERNVWVGGSSGGLARLKRLNFVAPSAGIGLPSTAPACLSEDDEGVIWVDFAESGLWRFEGAHATGPMTNAIAAARRTGWALHVGRNGTKWFGSYGAGLLSWRRQEVKLWTGKDGLPTNDIRALSEGPQGDLWIGCVLGLVRFDGTNFTQVNLRDGWPRREVNALALDQVGNLWAGTRDEGAARWSDGAVEVFRKEQGLPSDDVRTFLAEDDGSMWIGTAQGLACWRDGRIHSFDARNGLSDADVHSLVDDHLGHLWLGTSRGVLRVAFAELIAVAEGRTPRLTTVRSFGQDAGLPSVRMTRGQPGAIRARDGRLWFATLKGLSVIDPRDVTSNPIRPEVFFEEVLIDSVATPHPSAAPSARGNAGRPSNVILQVPADTRRLEFHYTTPILTAPERVRFQ